MTESSNNRPIVGAAVWAEDLENIDGMVAFLMDNNRDVEIRDFYLVDTLRDDWSPLSEKVRDRLDGHHGRIGIHGPFLVSSWTHLIATFAPSPRLAFMRVSMPALRSRPVREPRIW